MHLLQDIGKAYATLASFDCKKAITLFEALPSHQLNTCWVLQQIGTAYFEMTDYHRVRLILFISICCDSIVQICILNFDGGLFLRYFGLEVAFSYVIIPLQCASRCQSIYHLEL